MNIKSISFIVSLVLFIVFGFEFIILTIHKKHNKKYKSEFGSKYRSIEFTKRYNFIANDFTTINLYPGIKYDPSSLYETITRVSDESGRKVIIILANDLSDYDLIYKLVYDLKVTIIKSSLFELIIPMIKNSRPLVVDASNVVFYPNKEVVRKND